MARKKPAPDETPFEAALSQLERAVADLEAGELDLDASLARYEQGVRLLSHCHGLLDAAGRRVELLTGRDADGQAITVPFDGAVPLVKADDDLPF